MNKHTIPILAVVILALSVAGCPGPPPPPEKEEPTPEEIRAEGDSILNEIASFETPNPLTTVDQLRARLGSFRQKYSKYEEGRTMINMISNKLYNNASRMFEMENYNACLTASGCALAINPTHARALDLQRRAQEELAKPRVTLKGFFTTADQPIIVLVDIEYLETGQKESKQVKLGEEFDGYRFKKVTEDVTGKPIGIVLRWLKTGSDVELLLHGR